MSDQPLSTIARSYSSESRLVSGILINREPPISTGWCGNDECLHKTHIAMRRAQEASETRKTKK